MLKQDESILELLLDDSDVLCTFRPGHILWGRARTGDSRIQISCRQSDMCELHSSALWCKSHVTKQDVWGRGRECELPISRCLLTRQQGSRKQWEANHFSGRFKVPQSGIPFTPAAVCGLVFFLSFIKGGNCTCAIMSRLFPFTVSWIKTSQSFLERLGLRKYKSWEWKSQFCSVQFLHF